MQNPFGMDAGCTNCPALVESRASIVHGYGDVTAEFLFVREAPTEAADTHGHPTAEEDPIVSILDRAGFLSDGLDEDGLPRLDNAFVTHLTRCRHPDRDATDREVQACDPFLTAEIRSINPEIIVPVGQRALQELGREYSTNVTEDVTMADVHAETIRGRGFELVPLAGARNRTETHIESFLDALETIQHRDYRQTKGRRGR